MTAQTLDRGTISDQELPKKAYTVERARVPLVLKLFGLTALLIVTVVGIAVGITIQRANSVANDTVAASIASAARLFRDLESQRLQSLSLPTQLLGNDPNFTALIRNDLTPAPAEELAPVDPAAAAVDPSAAPVDPAATPQAPPATTSINILSIADQLEQRRQAFGTDLLLLLDDQGRLIARTDQPSTATPPMTDLYEQSVLVNRVIEEGSDAIAGVLPLDGKLYHAAIAPVGVGTPRITIAYLVNAQAINDRFANSIAESTMAGVVFTTKGASTSVRSSNAPSVDPKQIQTGGREVTVDQSRYIYNAQPLLSGKETVGTAIFLRSLDRELAPFREIERTLLIGGGAALLLAFLLSWLIAKRVTRPIEQLAGIAQAVTAGDYSVSPDISRNDEVGILGRSFGKMINSLRDKADLEELYAAMADKAGEAPAAAARISEPARLEEGTVLVTDLRGLPATVGEGDAASVIASIERSMRLQEREVARQDGEVREINGHRLISVFRGERGIIHAIRAARAINEEFASQHGGANAMSVGVGIATGEFVTGSVALDAPASGRDWPSSGTRRCSPSSSPGTPRTATRTSPGRRRRRPAARCCRPPSGRKSGSSGCPTRCRWPRCRSSPSRPG
jgi:HAMP domain-containing protein